MRRADPLIVGGGPAGAAAAIALAMRGLRPLLIERSRAPAEALCGGFLSWRTLETLAGLGVAPDGHRITRLRLFVGDAAWDCALPHPAMAISRYRLDQLLLARAVAVGAAVERGVAVRGLDDHVVRLDDGGEIATDRLLLATGKHELRGAARPVRAVADPALGLRVRLGPAPGLARLVGDAIELHPFDRGYMGIALQEDGSANLCMAVRRSRLHDAGSPHALFAALAAECPALGARLAFLDGEPRVDAIANVPYGWRAHTTRPGVYRLGDQAGVIPSLAGEGIGIALASGIAAAAAVASDVPATRFQEVLARRLAAPIAVAGLVCALAERRAGARALLACAAPPLVRCVARLTRINQSPVDEPAREHH